MAHTASVYVADLRVDTGNPRLPPQDLGQRETIRNIATLDRRKFLVLAGDIVANGISMADLPIVMPSSDGSSSYVVLEGNRRVVALKCLENPDLLEGAFEADVLRSFRERSTKYRSRPIIRLLCLVVEGRDDARHWIQLRHTGENEGAGVVPWGTEESARFRSRADRLPPHLVLLDILQRCGQLTPSERATVPKTSLQRLLTTPQVRAKLGVEIREGELLLTAPEQIVASATRRVVEDLATGQIKTLDIYEAWQRKDYAAHLPSLPVPPNMPFTPQAQAPTTPVPAHQPTHAIGATRRRLRKTLIPKDCSIRPSDRRIRDIIGELRDLDIQQYTNAISVLYRVFLELAIDDYISRLSLATPSDARLYARIPAVLEHLMMTGKLTQKESRPVRRACQRNSFLEPSISQLNEYVHNQYAFPAPTDLRTHWDNLERFLMAVLNE